VHLTGALILSVAMPLSHLLCLDMQACNTC